MVEEKSLTWKWYVHKMTLVLSGTNDACSLLHLDVLRVGHATFFSPTKLVGSETLCDEVLTQKTSA